MKKPISPFIYQCILYIFTFCFTSTVIYFTIMVNLVLVQGPTKNKELEYRINITFPANKISDLYYAPSHKQVEYIFNKSSLYLGRKNVSKIKVILLWSPLFTGMDFLNPGQNSCLSSEGFEINYEITSDRNRLIESDAVIFHVRTMSLTDIPRNRTQNQKWIFFSLEAPPYSQFHGLDFMYGMFNWTMTYRSDSDIVIPYGRILRKNNINFDTSDLYSAWLRKTKLATWMVSHCSTDGNREGYVQQLKKYIDVDTYGFCGLASCPFNKTNMCLENFSQRYFFFLAFENSICHDYVTEKFFRTLKYDMIPVVFGGGSYTDIAPPDSFVNVMEFPSPVALSSHLLRIASNFTLFSGYFKWRANKYVEDEPNLFELCQKLHSESFHKYSLYYDIKEWWIRKSQCLKWNGTSYVKVHDGI